MKKIFIKLFLLIFLTQTQAVCDDGNYEIKFKIDEEIITNFDLKKEINYLKVLNKTLQSLDQDKIFSLAQESLIREKIKKKEIEKYYKMNYASKDIEPVIDELIKSLGLATIEDLKNYLLNSDITINEIRKKLIIEKTWNKLMFEIYSNKININIDEINAKLDRIEEKKTSQKSFNLSEIVISETSKENYENKYKEIISSIDSVGFSETAIIYSKSSTARSGGLLGWFNENQLSNIILDKIFELDINQITDPISTAGGSVILIINEIKEVPFDNFNKDAELQKIITSEKNRQLNEFSIIHYKKVANKSYVQNL